MKNMDTVKILCYTIIATYLNTINRQKFAFGKNAGFDFHAFVGVRCVAAMSELRFSCVGYGQRTF